MEEPVFNVFSQDTAQQNGVQHKTKVPKISSKDQFLQRTGQILDVPVTPMVEPLGQVPNIVFPNRIQQWTAEQIVDMPVPKVEIASRSVELNRLSMCQPGKWRRCPSVWETRLSHSSFGSFEVVGNDLERLRFLVEEGVKVDTVAAGGGVTRMAVAGGE